MTVLLTDELRSRLIASGVEVLWAPNVVSLPHDCVFEPPCSLKWMHPMHRLRMGAFSYAVQGHFFDVSIGRYCSMGDQLEFGRGGHPKTWLSTSPFQYLQQPVFAVGNSFDAARSFHEYRPPLSTVAPSTFQPITVGNDVWVGHGAYVRPGVTIGDGAIVGARAVVTRDVAPYTIVAGNPARQVGQRFPDSIIGELVELKWWRFAPWQLGNVPFHDIRVVIDYLRSHLSGVEPYRPDEVSVARLASE